ncbi:peptidase [Cohnella endophytica]|uniref:Peptidase n=1 Tax=Cohnella endophytica TaxID=2419778 RepID=A0A494Y0C9_9BACL|nr:DUF1796 family putative cysteine peptidase [Cohnella endophytica]RKP56219.1 peptidase [Cohnella endophytica]
MKLQELKGTYDAIFSLGDLCLASLQLRQNNLRPFAGVLDWMGSPMLSSVNRLLKYRFYEFMEFSNLRVIGYADDTNIAVSDDAYHIVSSHDFEVGPNSLTRLGSYAEVKKKFDRRIRRFLEKAATCRRILFVRTEGDYEDVEALQTTLRGLVRHDFRVLVVNHTDVGGLVEDNWPLDKVCAVQLPSINKWTDNDHLWRRMFEGIQLSK